jgi:Thiamine-binding protein
MRVIGQAHSMLHSNGVVRIQSDIRVGTRIDKKQNFADKVKKVENILAMDDVDIEGSVANPSIAGSSEPLHTGASWARPS